MGIGLYTLCLLLFFFSPAIRPRLNLPEAVAQKQREFLQLKGGKSSLTVKPLEPTPQGFLRNLPQSMDLALTRPHFSNVRHLLSLAAFLEGFVMRSPPFALVTVSRQTQPLAPTTHRLQFTCIFNLGNDSNRLFYQ